MLKDLSEIIVKCRSAFDGLEHTGDLHINGEFASLLENTLKTLEPKSTFEIQPFSITLKNEHGLRTDLPSSLLWYGSTFWELELALSEYKGLLAKLKQYLAEKGHTASEIKAFLKTLPSSNYDPSTTIGKEIESFIFNTLSNYDSILFRKLLTEREWWFKPFHQTEQTSGKTLDRSDVFQSSFDLAARVIVANSSRLILVTKAFSSSSDLRASFENLSHDPVEYFDNDSTSEPVGIEGTGGCIPFVGSGQNKIYYGAPGTGKSYSLSQNLPEKQLIRTVFHPDTQYSDFVGCLKPIMKNGNVGYGFRAGPFTEAVIKAVQSPSVSFHLIIEEINRASAAAVFGEIFQLLDRDEQGKSVYSIHISDPDMLAYMNERTSDYFADGTLQIPSNLSLLATMNSSDQAVMPMDTAFKRRWQFKYLSIDYTKATPGSLSLNISYEDSVHKATVEWAVLAKCINEILASLNIPEDRLLGHRFVSEGELASDSEETLKGKLFMYLWDDVLRHGQHAAVFKEFVESNGYSVELTNFGQLIEAFEAGKAVFSDDLEFRILEASRIVPSEGEEIGTE